jgi:hypothetical protein
MVIDWVSVDSSVFEAVAYRRGEGQLYLKFHKRQDLAVLRFSGASVS